MAIPKNTEFTDHTGNSVVIQYHAARLPPNDWQRRACGIGAKGFRVYDWALLESDDPDHQYMIRHSIDDGELDFYHCYNPRREGFGELVRVAGSRWPIEECLCASKSGVGLDDYQVRLYHAWYRHVTLAMLAHAFLTVCAHKHKTKKGDHHANHDTRKPSRSTIVDPATRPTPPPHAQPGPVPAGCSRSPLPRPNDYAVVA